MTQHFATIKDINDYFRKYWRVRDVTVDDMKIPDVVDIYIKSWIPLRSKHVKDIIAQKSMTVQIKIQNKSLFGTKEFII